MYGLVKNGNPVTEVMFMLADIGRHPRIRVGPGFRVIGDVMTVMGKNGYVVIGEEGNNLQRAKDDKQKETGLIRPVSFYFKSGMIR